jgi:hypothetical protein
MKITSILKKSAIGLVVGASMATAAAAATFNISGGTSTVLPAGYNPACNPACLTPAVGDSITAFNGSGGGLSISSPATLNFTFIGKEAGAQNAAFTVGGASITNTGGYGAMMTAFQNVSGLLNFMFTTKEGGLWDDINGNGVGTDTLSIANGGPTQFNGLSMAFGKIFNSGKSVYAFFGDGRGDVDYDDMVVRIDIVPLPATALLMFGALGGLGALRSRKKKAATA